jgi:hypothetical protein
MELGYKFASYYENVIKYNFCLEHFPHLVSHIRYTQFETNLSKVEISGRVEYYLNELYIPTSMVTHMYSTSFEMSEKCCEKFSCNRSYPLSKSCSSKMPTKLILTGSSKIYSCQPACANRNLPDLYWNYESKSCRLSNVIKKSFASDPSMRSPKYVSGLSNTPTLDFKQDQISGNQKYCNYFNAQYNKQTGNCEYSAFQRVTHFFAGPETQQALYDGLLEVAKHTSPLVKTIVDLRISQDTPRFGNIEDIPNYLRNRDEYLDDVNPDITKIPIYHKIEEDRRRSKRSTNEVLDYIDQNLYASVLASMALEVSLDTIPAQMLKVIKSNVKLIIANNEFRQMAMSINMPKRQLMSLTARVIANTLFTSKALQYLTLAANSLKLSNIVLTMTAIVDMILSSIKIYGMEYFNFSIEQMNKVYDKHFASLINIPYVENPLENHHLEFTVEAALEALISSSESILPKYVAYATDMYTKLSTFYLTEMWKEGIILNRPPQQHKQKDYDFVKYFLTFIIFLFIVFCIIK